MGKDYDRVLNGYVNSFKVKKYSNVKATYDSTVASLREKGVLSTRIRIKDKDEVKILTRLFENEGFEVLTFNDNDATILDVIVNRDKAIDSVLIEAFHFEIKRESEKDNETLVKELIDFASNSFMEKHDLKNAKAKFAKALKTIKDNIVRGDDPEAFVTFNSGEEESYLMELFTSQGLAVERVDETSTVPVMKVALPVQLVKKEVSRKLGL